MIDDTLMITINEDDDDNEDNENNNNCDSMTVLGFCYY
jgi:hypothetical protein